MEIKKGGGGGGRVVSFVIGRYLKIGGGRGEFNACA